MLYFQPIKTTGLATFSRAIELVLAVARGFCLPHSVVNLKLLVNYFYYMAEMVRDGKEISDLFPQRSEVYTGDPPRWTAHESISENYFLNL